MCIKLLSELSKKRVCLTWHFFFSSILFPFYLTVIYHYHLPMSKSMFSVWLYHECLLQAMWPFFYNNNHIVNKPLKALLTSLTCTFPVHAFIPSLKCIHSIVIFLIVKKAPCLLSRDILRFHLFIIKSFPCKCCLILIINYLWKSCSKVARNLQSIHSQNKPTQNVLEVKDTPLYTQNIMLHLFDFSFGFLSWGKFSEFLFRS